MKKKITAYVARNKMADLYMYNKKPRKSDFWPEWFSDEGECFEIDWNFFPQVKWEDEEPTEVELTIKIKY